ncbi:ChbG/HpnK family deacetylase [Azorhizophilus paspali]|uniref:ChbG/HpnK family deacetylase n=1 Tax=Azorhizophilus paspali TaxID=69963 RepID=A0ABV6SM81_AZOPA
MPNRVIVNADDFGLNREKNAVIVRAFRCGLISSATLMANMPAFAQACALIHAEGLHGRVGLHVNLTHGRPLSETIANLSCFCDATGEFHLRLPRYRLWLGRATRAAIDEELEAQWQRCLYHGVRPSHLDSHQHVHNIWPVGEQLARFAAARGVPLRLARNLGNNLGPIKRLFKSLLNRRLRQLAGRCAEHVCTTADLRDQPLPAQGTLEVIAHPCNLDRDFGDAYLAPGESLAALLERRLGNVPRTAYGIVEMPVGSPGSP